MTKLEEIAQAIAAYVAKCPITPEIPYEVYLPVARAAVEAMREPTLPMMEVGSGFVLSLGGNTAEVSAGEAYTAMIDAILNEEPGA